MARMNRLGCSLAAALLMAGTARAGTLSMDVRCVVQGSNLLVHVVNRGDEAAKNVSAKIEFMGAEVVSPAIETMEPNQPRVIPARMPMETLRGAYPAVVTLGFEDLNGYPFSSVSPVIVRSDDARQSALLAVFDVSTIRGQTEVPVRVHNESDQAINARYRILTPRELVTQGAEGTIVVPPHASERVTALVENFSAMPGSQYGMHAILEYEQDGLHYTTTAGTSVQVFPEGAAKTVSFWVVVAAVAVVLVAIVLIQRRRTRRG